MTADNRAELCRQANAVRAVFSPYDRVRAVHADIETLHARDNGASEGGILTLFGDSRSGKTKILRSYAKRYPTVRKGKAGPDGEFADLMEVVSLRVPDTSVKTLLERLLATLTNVSITRVTGRGARRFDIQEDIVAVAKEVGVKLIILEEAHQAIDTKNVNTIKNVAGVLKDLTNESRFSLVVSGTNEAKRLFEVSPELEGRVLYEHELTPLSWDNEAERTMFLEVLEDMDTHLGEWVFGRLSGLTDEKFAKPLLKAGLGHVGHVALLVEVAALAAVDDMLDGRCRSLTLGHFAGAFAGSPLRHRHEGEASPFPTALLGPNAGLPIDAMTKLRGRTRSTNRDVDFKR